jgi:deoxyribonuclease-4
MIGAHMPTAGGIHLSISAGKAIGCETVQLFTASPRQWRSSALKAEMIEAFVASAAEHGISTTIAHDSYLINLAAPEGSEIRLKSLSAFRDELERAEALGISYLVTHMGAHLGEGDDVGLKRLIAALNQLHMELPGYRVRIALETTAGQGTGLGASFDHFPIIYNGVVDHDRLAVCMDTCHIFASGHDIRTPEAYAATMDEFAAKVGFDKLKVIHANDSQKGLASRVDRHAHIGEGEIGIDAFRLLLTDPRIAGLPVVVETPEAETMHEVNVARLRALIPN